MFLLTEWFFEQVFSHMCKKSGQNEIKAFFELLPIKFST
jgi:hypothetical protein